VKWEGRKRKKGRITKNSWVKGHLVYNPEIDKKKRKQNTKEGVQQKNHKKKTNNSVQGKGRRETCKAIAKLLTYFNERFNVSGTEMPQTR